MREEETLTWLAGGDGDNGEALAGQLCFLSSVPSSAFLFLLFGFFFSLDYVLSPSVIPPLCFFLFLSSGSSFFFGLQGAIEDDDISVGFLGFFVCVFSVFFSCIFFLCFAGFLPSVLLCFFFRSQSLRLSVLPSSLFSVPSFSLFGSVFFFLSVFFRSPPVYAGFLLPFSPIPPLLFLCHSWLL